MADEPQITPEELATFRRCRFENRVFACYPALRSAGCLQPYRGEAINSQEWEWIEGGWDHEHCDVCWAKITDAMTYWSNVAPDPSPHGSHVDLCEACYPRVMALLADESIR